jgi:hypothetical protein
MPQDHVVAEVQVIPLRHHQAKETQVDLVEEVVHTTAQVAEEVAQVQVEQALLAEQLVGQVVTDQRRLLPE